ncbi:N-formylglutamate amidohydrolase [uncultured Ferrovibrio sp.]|jgi:N-formylglutamate amidohydrolase|uniref:N-formylglutamate amidohydrolase n=1 Tax=uncultured Ferrovibrio sp. TaxID=1576913 RepID=UPI0026311B0D|nr:N-formylglutamate amidohydrolase [uncultured Ferrovibrio sp.]
MSNVLRGVYHRFDPTVPPVPVMVDVSRSGREYPAEFRSMVPFTVLHDNVSMYVDDLWEAAPDYGATMLYASFPSFWIDANRNELDIDADLIDGEWPVPLQPTVSKRGLGLLKSKSRYGEPVHERKLTVEEVMERIKKYHRPYYAELKQNIDRMKSAFGFVYHLSCHCMSAVGAPTHPDPGKERPDFCLGDVNGTTSSREFIEFVQKTIQSLGYSCTINDPYSGGELNTRFGRPQDGIDSIMVEINKKLFMDVKTFKKKPEFARVQADVTKILAAITQHARQRIAKAG